MSTKTKSELPERVGRNFAGYRRRWHVLATSRGLLLSWAIAIGIVGGAIWADRLFRLPSGPRTVLLLALLGTFAFLLVRWVLWRLIRRIGDREAAVKIGRCFPEMKEDLVSAVELGAMAEGQEGVSHSLVESALAGIGRRAEKVDYRRAVPLGPLMQGAVLFLLLAGALAVMHRLRPEAIGNALERLFRPNSQVPFFCYTKLRMLSSAGVIAQGDTVEVSAEIWGRRPKTARLEARNGGEPLRVDLECNENLVSWQSGQLFEDLEYRMLAGDAVSDWQRVRVVAPPAVGSMSAQLRYPEYAGAEEQTIEQVERPLEIVAGTSVLLAAVPIDRGPEDGFRCRGQVVVRDEKLELTADAAGVLRTKWFSPGQGGKYTIQLSDGFGLKNRGRGVSIKLVADRLPVVSISSPGQDLVVLAGEAIGIEAMARDEFGLRGLNLSYRTIKGDMGEEVAGSWQVRKLKEGGVKVKELEGQTALSIEELGIKPGEVLEYRAQAADYASEATFRRGYSRSFRVIVLGKGEHLAMVLGRLRQVQMELLRLAAEQEAKAAKAGELAELCTSGSVSQEVVEVQRAEAELARKTEALAREIESLIPELVRNPSAPMKTMAELEKLGRDVRSVADNPMTKMGASLGQAGESTAGQQSESLKEAQGFGEQAARELESLADMAERAQRRGILEKLASEAERLAGRQLAVRQSTIPLAPKTAGLEVGELENELKGLLERLSGDQASIKKGTEALGEHIAQAVESLGFSDAASAALAEEAGEKLESDKVGEQAGRIAKRMSRNVLFSSIEPQGSVAESLKEVAEILRRSAEGDSLAGLTKRLEEFIRRQTGINRNIKGAMAKAKGSGAGLTMGMKQAGLEREVSEQASALEWLGRELESFRSETAGKLSAAAGQMEAGAGELYKSELDEGLKHGQKALEFLVSAREKLSAESGKLAQAGQGSAAMEAMLLLYRIILGQQKVNRGTIAADDVRENDAGVFARQVGRLAQVQKTVREDTGRLGEGLGWYSAAGELLSMAGTKMEASGEALKVGDTGADTRVVQAQALLLLEKLLEGCKGSMAGQCNGLAMARMQAMMQMMAQSPGAKPGGFYGGQNAAVLPATIREAENQSWRMVRSRFEEQLGQEFEGQYPAEFRALLDAYFDRLRKEPPR